MSPLEQALTDAVVAALAPQLTRVADELAAIRQAIPAELVSLDVAAKRLGVTRSTVNRMRARGELAVKKVGSRVLVDPASLRPAKAKGEV